MIRSVARHYTGNVLTWLAAVALSLTTARPAPADPLGPWAGSQIAMAGAAEVWRTQLPLGYTQKIKSYHLLGGYLYAIGDDGAVRAIRADTGRHVWTQRLAAPFETLWPPVAAVLPEGPAVLFTRTSDVLFLDIQTGRELKRIPLTQTAVTAVAISEKNLFEVGARGRVGCIRLEDGLSVWAVATPGTIATPPIWQADGDELIVLDDQGTLASFSEDKEQHFVRSLEARPVGRPAVDPLAIYLATTDGVLHAIERKTGSLLWNYHMVERPAGGSLVTRAALYQATATGELYRFDLAVAAALATQPAPGQPLLDAAQVTAAVPNRVPSTQPEPGQSARKVQEPQRDLPRIDAFRELRRWYYPAGKQFLAEWPNRVLVLCTDGLVGLIPTDSVTGEPAELLDLGSIAGAVSNLVNDAVILTSPQGEIRYLRPVGAAPLKLADFGTPSATQPAAAPDAAPAEEAAPPAEQAAPAGQDTLLTDPLRSRKALAQ
jgi:hypothetical protein